MKVLAIGNSFSQDATRYLHRISAGMPVKIKTVNLYIGGCPLKTHYINMLEDKKDYMMEYNGEATGFKVSIKDALISDDWDYVTLQQVSQLSTKYDTYKPYIDELAAYIRKYSPKSKLLVHQTWAYEEDSERLHFKAGYNTAAEMLNDLQEAYSKAAKDINADGVIPCGEVLMKLHENGIEKVHRDTFHASFGVGRYVLALTWYKYLTGLDISDVMFKGFDVTVTEEEIAVAKKTVSEVVI